MKRVGKSSYTRKDDSAPKNLELIEKKGIQINPKPNDIIGLSIGLKDETDIFGNQFQDFLI